MASLHCAQNSDVGFTPHSPPPLTQLTHFFSSTPPTISKANAKAKAKGPPAAAAAAVVAPVAPSVPASALVKQASAPVVVSLTAQQILAKATQDADTKSAPFNQAKLMVVGRGRSGKTSTVSALLGQVHNDKQLSTIGASTVEVDARLEQVEAQAWNKSSHSELQQMLIKLATHDGKPAAELPSTAVQMNDMLKEVRRKTRKQRSAQALSGGRPASPPKSRDTGASSMPARATTAAPEQQPAEPPAQPPATSGGALEQSDRKTPTLFLDEVEDDGVVGLRELLANISLGTESDTDSAADDHIRFSIWDLAGQTVFYDLLHMLLTK